MTREELKDVMSNLSLNSADVAMIVGVTRRGVQLWMSGDVPVPQNVAIFLRAIVEGLLPMTWVEDQVIDFLGKGEKVSA